MSQTFSCPCDAPTDTPPQNPPGLPIIAYRDTDYVAIREALLTPLPGETQLTAWRPGATGDLAVMMAEWFAYLGDIITFYNERIANEDYLGTATMASSVTNLIRLLGYRPQPGVAASVTLAALLQTGPNFGQIISLPVGLQVTSKPAPGQPPQTFELFQKTALAAPDVATATAPLALLSPSANTILLAGAVSSILPNQYLLLRPRASHSPTLVLVSNAAITAPPSGPQQTTLTVSFPGAGAATGNAATYRLDKSTLTAPLWTLTAGFIDSSGNIHFAGLVRSIKPGDPLIFVIAGGTPVLASVATLQDVVWNASGAMPSLTSTTTNTKTSTTTSGSTSSSSATSTSPSTALFPHTMISLAGGVTLPPGTAATSITVQFNFVEAATLLDQPVPIWPGPNAGSPPALFSAAGFPQNAGATNVLIADTTGAGLPAQVSVTGPNGVTVAGLPSATPSLQTPLSVMYNLLPFTCGKTVASEVLGSGNPTAPNQSFTLAKSPLTYLRPAAVLVSTLTVKVNGQVWTEVPNLFNQPASAQVFVTSQDSKQITTVMFGDGVNGARLPAGNNNIIASYRYGSGSASPPAGALITIATPYPGLRAVLNPVAAGGGADPDPASQIQTYAPRSVLTFGRAVSAFDYEAIAAQIAAGTRVAALWAFDVVSQRGAVTVYVADDGPILASVQNGLAAVGDPTRPVNVLPATPVTVLLLIEVLITATADAPTVQAGIVSALTDPRTGLFGAQNLGIGQSVFNSQIAAACQTVPGYIAIEKIFFLRLDPFRWEDTQLHQVPAGSYFDLDPSDVFAIIQVAGNG